MKIRHRPVRMDRFIPGIEPFFILLPQNPVHESFQVWRGKR